MKNIFIFITTSIQCINVNAQIFQKSFDIYTSNALAGFGQYSKAQNNDIKAHQYLQTYRYYRNKLNNTFSKIETGGGESSDAQQKTDSSQSVRKRWEIGIIFSTVAPLLVPEPFQHYSYFNYGSSVLIKYKFSSNHISILSGINYDIIEYRIEWSVAPGKKYFYKYLSIPFLLDISLGKKKFSVDIGYGLVGGIFIDKENIYTNNIILFDDSQGAIMSVIKIGANYHMKNGMKIFLTPQIYYGITTITYQTITFIGDLIGETVPLRYFKIATGISYTF